MYRAWYKDFHSLKSWIDIEAESLHSARVTARGIRDNKNKQYALDGRGNKLFLSDVKEVKRWVG